MGMIISLASEELPRRCSNQSIEITRKNLENFISETCFLNHQKALTEKSRFFFFSIMFQLYPRNNFQYLPNFRVSIPFGYKPTFIKNIGNRNVKTNGKKKTHFNLNWYLTKLKTKEKKISGFSFVKTLFLLFFKKFN